MLKSMVNLYLSGKKVLVLFVIVLLPVTTFAQDKMLGEISKQVKGKPKKITKQQLNSKLVNEWGEKELKFLELKNGSLIPMKVEKLNKLSKIQDTQDDEWWIYVAVAAGIVLIVVLIAALGFVKEWDKTWDYVLNDL